VASWPTADDRSGGFVSTRYKLKLSNGETKYIECETVQREGDGLAFLDAAGRPKFVIRASDMYYLEEQPEPPF